MRSIWKNSVGQGEQMAYKGICNLVRSNDLSKAPYNNTLPIQAIISAKTCTYEYLQKNQFANDWLAFID